jgi:electron transport complex protein RnfD
MLLGKTGGSLGETCAVALIVGGVWLVCRRVITPTIPLVFIGTTAAVLYLCGADPIKGVLSGGLLIGAIFMATDYVTSPTTEWGKVIFAFGCGLITAIIRVYGSLPEGVSFAILLMNILTPHIDRLVMTRPFGTVKAKKEAQ